MKYLKLENLSFDSTIKIISLNRPEVKNAFHPQMISELKEAFLSFQSESAIKAVILKGEGSNFCSGADLNWMKEMAEYSFEKNLQDSSNLWEMFDAITQCSAPVIGVIHGAVYGGAIGLVACCDYVIAEERTHFCFSEVKLGLAPAVISSFALRKLADGFVRPYMLSAEIFQTETALRMGLIHSLSQNLANWTEEIKKFSENGLEAMRATKKLLNQINSGLSWPEQKKITTQLISELRASPEAQARLKRFIQKSNY